MVAYDPVCRLSVKINSPRPVAMAAAVMSVRRRFFVARSDAHESDCSHQISRIASTGSSRAARTAGQIAANKVTM